MKAKKCFGDEVVILEKFVEINFHGKGNFQWEVEFIFTYAKFMYFTRSEKSKHYMFLFCIFSFSPL